MKQWNTWKVDDKYLYFDNSRDIEERINQLEHIEEKMRVVSEKYNQKLREDDFFQIHSKIYKNKRGTLKVDRFLLKCYSNSNNNLMRAL